MLNRIMTLSALTLLSTSATYAQVTNGDFESWTNNTPNGWTTIDSGIALSQSSSVFKSGKLAAAIAVNTGTQSETDFTQLVQVEQGKTYQFSVSLYHTEGKVKALLIVDGYQGYSNNGLVNQWQDLTFAYTATATKEIAVGLRFYDMTGFDGSETVYIDNFQPTETTTTPTEPTSCANTTATLTLITDQYGISPYQSAL